MSDRKAIGSCSDRPSLSTDQSHHDVELAPGSVFVHRVELWALVPALRAADPVVLVHLDDLIAHAGCHLPQLTLLVGRGLIKGADPEINSGATHRVFPQPLDQLL